MKTLKAPLGFLLIYMGIVFNIEVIPISADFTLNMHRFVDVLIIFIVISSLLVRPLHKLPFYAQVNFWVIVYFGLWFLSAKSESVQVNLLVMIIEVAIITVATILSWRVADRLFDFEDTLDRLALASFQRRTLSMDEAAEEINTEVLRSRRYQRDLTVLVIEPDPATVKKVMVLMAEEIQHSLSNRYAIGQISELISSIARRPDMVIRMDQQNRFVILCPETDAGSSLILRQRIQTALKTSLGVSISMGMASFPDDALTFDELLKKASARLTPPVPSTLPVARLKETDA